MIPNLPKKNKLTFSSISPKDDETVYPFKDAAAIYSLRSVGNHGFNPVVRVRRDSDNSERDFSADDINNGFITTWTNRQTVKPLDIRALVSGTSNDGRTGDFIIAKAAYSLRSLGDRQPQISNVFPDSYVISGAGTTAVNGTYVKNGNSPESGERSLPAYTLFDTDGTTALFSLIGEFGGDNFIITGTPSGGGTVQYEGSNDFTDYSIQDADNGSEPVPSVTSSETDKYVVAIRRASDNSLKQFTADELNGDALASFVSNLSVSIYTSTFTDDTDGWSAGNTGTSPSFNQTVGGISPAISWTGEQGTFYVKSSVVDGLIELNQKVRITGKAFSSTSTTLKVANAYNTVSDSPSQALVGGEWADFDFTISLDGFGGSQARVGLAPFSSGSSISSLAAGVTFALADLTVEVVADNGFVETWYDQSVSDQAGTSTGNHANQTNFARQPKIVSAGKLNSSHGLEFDGSDDLLPLKDSFSFQNKAGCIFSLQDGQDNNNDFTLGVSNSNRGIAFKTNQTNWYFTENPINIDNSSSTSGLTLFTALHDGTTNNPNVKSYVNGSEIVDSSPDSDQGGANVATAANQIGARKTLFFLEGTVKEIIIYDTDQTDNRTAFESNIAEHYGISGIPSEDDTVNGFVETWYDQSGNGNDLTQTTATKQPSILSGGVINTRNNKPIIKFISANETFLDGPSTIPPGGSNFAFTSFQALHVDASSSARLGVFGSKSSGNNPGTSKYNFGSGTSKKANMRIQDASDTVTNLSSPSLTDNTDALLTYMVKLDSGNLELQTFNLGSQIGTTQTASITDQSYTHVADTIVGARAGNDNFSDSEFFEVLYYTTDQTSNRVLIETNMNDTYNIF